MSQAPWRIVAGTLRLAQAVAAALAVLAAMAGVTQAGSPGSTSGSGVPAINPNSLISAVTLLVGGALMIHDTMRRQRLGCKAKLENDAAR